MVAKLRINERNAKEKHIFLFISECPELTQEQLAAKIGTKKSYISKIENGHADIQLSTLFRIFGGLGKRVSLSVL